MMGPNDSYTLSRIGIIGVAPHRFLDVINDERVEKLNLYYFENEKNAYNSIVNCIEKYMPDKKKKFEGFDLPWPSMYNLTLMELSKQKTDGPVMSSEIFSNFPNVFYKFVKDQIACTDVLWIGDNDFDTSFIFATLSSMLGLDYVLSLKETRFVPYAFELEALKRSKFVILPHDGYIDFFKKKYSINLEKKAVFADIDWRSKFVYDFLSNSKVEKLSEKDGKNHVVILSGRVVWNSEETRSQGRYYYVPIIQQLLEEGFVVHLHTKVIIESLDNPVYYEPNPYTELMKKFQGNFLIERPIDLNDVENYKLLMRYDLGLLNSGIGGKDEFNEFEKINVPNRFYEYLHAGVVPISPSGMLQYMESKFSDQVLFFKDVSELRSLLNTIDEGSYKPKNFFADFLQTLLDTNENFL